MENSYNSSISLLLTILLILLLPSFAFGQSVSWTGGGDGSSWDDSANWSTGSVPGTGSEVMIDLNADSAYSIEINQNRTVASLSMDSRDPVLVLNSDLNITGDYYQNFSTLTGSADLTVDGELFFDNGIMSGSGSTIANGDSQIDSGILDTRRFVVASGQTLRKTKSMDAKNGAILEIESGAIFENENYRSMSVTSDSDSLPQIINRGLIRSSINKETAINWSVANYGTIRANAGNHTRLAGRINDNGGTYEAVGQSARLDIMPTSDATFNESSLLTADSGARLHLGHSSDSETPPLLTISGTLRADGILKLGESFPPVEIVVTQSADVQSAGGDALIVGDRAAISFESGDPINAESVSINFEGELSVNSDLNIAESLNLNNASAVFESDKQTTVQGSMNWEGGAILGDGTITTAGGMQITGGAGSSSNVKQLDGHQIVIPDGALAIYSGSLLRGRNGAILEIENGGTFDIQHWGDFERMSESDSIPTIVNRGTFEKTSGGSETDVQWAVENHGVIEAADDVLKLSGPITDQKGTYRVLGNSLIFQQEMEEILFQDGSTIEADSSSSVHFRRHSESESQVVYEIEGAYDVHGTTTLEGSNEILKVNIDSGAGPVNVGQLDIDRNGVWSSQRDLTVSGPLNLLNTEAGLASSKNITVEKMINWEGGRISGQGTLQANGGIQMPRGAGSASFVKRIDQHHLVITEGATGIYNGAKLRGGNGAVIEVEEGGIFDIQTFNDLNVFSGSSSLPKIINRGTFQKTNVANRTSINWAVENYGTILIDFGRETTNKTSGLPTANSHNQTDDLRLAGPFTDHDGAYRIIDGQLSFRPALEAVTFKSGSELSSDTTGTISFGRQGGAEPRDTSLVYRISGTIDMDGITRVAGGGEADVTVLPDANVVKLAGTALEMDDNSGVFRSEIADSLIVGGIRMGRNNELYIESPLFVEGDVFQDDSRIETNYSIEIDGQYTWSGGNLVGSDTLTANGGLMMNDGGVVDSLHVLIPGGETAVINVRGFGSNRLYGRNGASLEVEENARLEIQGWNDIDLASGSSASPALINRGIITNTGGYDMVIRWPLENSGEVDVQNGRIRFAGPVTDQNGMYQTSGARLDFYSDSDIELLDESTVNIDSEGEMSINSDGDFKINGDLTVDGGFYTESPVKTEGTVTLNDPGTIIFGTPGSVSNNPDSVVHLIEGGELLGTGFITGDVVSDSGSVHPGGKEQTGTLTIQGDYTQRAGGSLDLELGGTSPGDGYDRLDTDNAEIGGELRLSLINGYSPGSNEVLEPFRWSDSRSGSFSSVDYSEAGDVNLGTEYSSNALRIFDGSLPDPPSAPTISVRASAPPFARTDRSIPVNVEITSSSQVAIGILETDNINFGADSPTNDCPTDDAYENLKCRMAPFGVVPPEPPEGEEYPFLTYISAQQVLSASGSTTKDGDRLTGYSNLSADSHSDEFNDNISKLTTSRAAFIGSGGFNIGGSASCPGGGQNFRTTAGIPGPIMTNESLDRCAAEAGTKILKNIGSAIIPGFECYSLYSDISGQLSSGFKNNHDMAAAMASNVLGALDCAGDFVPATKAIKIMQDLNSQIRTVSDFETCFAQGGGGGGSDGSQITCVGAIDPNEKLGPQGVNEERFTSRKDSLPYTVFFENKAEATAPAQQVFIYDTLETDAYDFDSFTFGAVAFGDTSITTPNDTLAFDKEVDLRPGQDLLLKIEGAVDKQAGVLSWTFTSVDPETGEPVSDPLAGFLPPNDEAPEGEGSVSYYADIGESVTSGRKVASSARIIFDQNEPIDTQTWSNILDFEAPQSEVNSLATTQDSTGFRVSWSGSDAESGVRTYSVYVSEDGNPYSAWIEDTTATSAVYTGKKGSEYRFYSLASDSVGNDEAAPGEPDAITTVSGNATSTEPGGDEIPEQFTLEQNYPNPFNPATTIRFGLPEESQVTLTVYNTMGREVASLIQNERRTAGWYDATFDASNLSSGVYIYRLQTDERSESKKLTLIK